MSKRSSAPSRYALSFTTGGLMEVEAVALAPLYLVHRDWATVRSIAVEENLLQARTLNSGSRRVRETIKRLSALSDREVDLFPDLTATERGHLLWAAACRRYELIGEFAEEVLRERFLTLVGTVSYEDYDSFFQAKAMWHEELDAVSVSTYKKLRQVLFRMMSEAGLRSSSGDIETVLISARVADCLTRTSPSDLRFFPTRMV